MEWLIPHEAELSRGDIAVKELQNIRALAYPGDHQAHEWRVTVKNHGEPVDLSTASITAYIKREDGTIILLSGTGDANGIASVTFVQACYAQPGAIQGIMRAHIGENVVTIGMLNARIMPSMTSGTIIDPDSVIPDIDTLIAEIERMEQSIAVIEKFTNVVATATTLAEGSSATASVSQTSDTTTFAFGIPKGDTGATGATGAKGDTGATGNGISTIAKTGTSGNVDTYTITFTNGTTTTFTVTNGEISAEDLQEAIDGTVVDIALNSTQDGLIVTYGDGDTVLIPVSTSGGADLSEYHWQYDVETGYLHMLDEDEEDVLDPVWIGGGGGGGGGSTISLTNVVKVTTVRNGADALFSFTATASDDTSITTRWYVDNVLYQTTEDDSGSTFSFNAKGLLKESNSSLVKVQIQSEGGGTLTRQWTVTSTAFSISWGASINPIMLYTSDENIFVVVNVQAEVGTTNLVSVLVGQNAETRTVVGSRSVTIELNKSWFSLGENTVTATMSSSTDITDKAEDISFVALWGYGATNPLVAFEHQAQTGMQYSTIPIRYFVYDPNNEIATCTIQVGEEDARIVSADRTIRTFNYAPQTYGSYTVTLTCGSSTDTLALTVTKSDYNIGIVTGDSLRYNLDPVGHSNADADREQFADLTFSANFDWINGGFQTDADGAAAFVVKKGNRATLPRSLFADSDANGKTIDVSFRVVNSDQYDAVAMQDLNVTSSKGLILRSNAGELRLDNASGQEFRYCEESRIDFSVLVEDLTNQRLVTIWLDGIPSKVDAYEPGMLTHSDNNLVIGSDHCDVWVYAIRVYNTKLSIAEMIQNYVSLGSTTEQKIARYTNNNIFDANGKITPQTLHTAAPSLTLIEIAAERMTVSKKDKVAADITITDGSTVLELPASGTSFMVQGTSSAAYGRSSYNLDLDFKKTGKTYQISETSIPVNYLNVKVNVASSECANNVNAVDWYNTFQPYLTESRETPGVRDTIEGKPCAVFITNTANEALWFSSQYVQPGETILYAMGDLCNSKKNLAVFGEDGSGEHPTKACIEVSGNDTAAQQFRATATYNYEDGEWQNTTTQEGQTVTVKEFEWRMEPDESDLEEVVEAWDDTVAWVVSTIDNAAKFKSEVGNYFAIDSLLYHFLFIEFFAAYDNVSKNTFYSYDYDEQAGKYLFNIKCAYDMDTIIAADNDGKPYGDYGIDYGDTIGGRSYFNAIQNPIWLNIKAAYQSELSAMYILLRSRGAWNNSDIIAKWDAYQSIRPHAAMVQDAYTKYIAPYKTTGVVIDGTTLAYDDSYLPRLQGSKTYQRRQFMTYQTDYMDGKYGYYSKTNSTQFRTNGESGHKNFAVKVYAKTYITVLVDDNKVSSQKVEAGSTVTFLNVSVGSNTTLYFTPDRLIQYIRPLNETQNSTFVASGAAKLMEAILGGNTTNTSWLSGTALNVPSPILHDLSIRNIQNFSSALNLTPNVELQTLDTRGTNAGRITLPPNAPLTEIHLNACTGIVAQNLHHVSTLDIASGENLISVRVENCNEYVMDELVGILEEAEDSLLYLRVIGIDWELEDTALLNKLLTVGRINDNGETGEPPCVLEGHVTVPVLKESEDILYRAAWPNLTVSYSSYVNQHAVTFKNTDGTTLYIEYVDQGSNAVDPVVNGDIPTPTRESTEEYNYTYRGWDGSLNQISAPRTLTAQYTATRRSYTVRWFAQGVMMDEQTIEYGSEAVYSGNPPTYTAEEPMLVFYLWTGKWDQSTGRVTGPMNVNAVFERADLSVPISSTEDMTAAYLYGLRQRGASYVQNALDIKDRIMVQLGYMPDYSNIESWETTSVLEFDGVDDYVDTGIDLLSDGIASGWTVALDYAFEDETDGRTIMSLWQDNGAMGFKVSYGASESIPGSVVSWGNATYNNQKATNREIIVLRHIPGSQTLYCYVGLCDTMQIGLTVLSKLIDTQTSKTLMLGCDQSDVSGRVSFAKGTVYKCKVWYGDIGNAECQKIARWPYEQVCMELAGYAGYELANQADTYTVADFISAGLLSYRTRMNPTGTNSGGYGEMQAFQWLEQRVKNAIPNQWKSIIQTVKVPCVVRVSDNVGTIHNVNASVFIPSLNEIAPQNDEPQVYEGTPTPWMTASVYRAKFASRWASATAQYFTQNTDPSLVPSNNVQDGDVWRDMSNNPDTGLQGYSKLRVNGAWVFNELYRLRTSLLDNTNGFYIFNAVGTYNNSSAYNSTHYCIRFSV